MTSLHKFLFIGAVILSVVAGNYFTVEKSSNVKRVASIIVSAPDAAAENNQPAPAIQPATPNDSTTPNDARTGGQPDVNQDDNAKTALDNGALLKTESAPVRGAFQRIGSDGVPDIQARAALIADLKTGQSYLEFNPTLRWPTASLAELMTAVMVSKNIDLKKPVTIGDAGIPADGLKAGDVLSGNDVLAAMLLASGDGAAETLAAVYGRSDFVAGMNSLAKEFGMGSTNFSDPTGISVSDQSTAGDLEKLALNIYRDYPKIFEITRKKSGTVTELNSKKRKTISNANSFAGTSGFIGGGTGYSDDAGGNALSVFSYNSRPVLVIVLGADDRSGETEKLTNWFEKNYK